MIVYYRVEQKIGERDIWFCKLLARLKKLSINPVLQMNYVNTNSRVIYVYSTSIFNQSNYLGVIDFAYVKSLLKIPICS